MIPFDDKINKKKILFIYKFFCRRNTSQTRKKGDVGEMKINELGKEKIVEKKQFNFHLGKNASNQHVF